MAPAAGVLICIWIARHEGVFWRLFTWQTVVIIYLHGQG